MGSREETEWRNTVYQGNDPGEQLVMDRARFQRDRFLCASGYNLLIWAVINLLISIPAISQFSGSVWSRRDAFFLVGVLVAFGVLLSKLNQNRVAKLCGPGGDVVINARRIWAPALRVGIFLTFILLAHQLGGLVRPVWMVVLGLAYRQWGEFTIPEFRMLGSLLVMAGLIAGLSLAPEALDGSSPSALVLMIWIICASLTWFGLGVWINRKYLYPVSVGTSTHRSDGAG